jgi:hypothetical protein
MKIGRVWKTPKTDILSVSLYLENTGERISFRMVPNCPRARKRAAALESPDKGVFKPIGEAATAFLDHRTSEALRSSTIRKHRNSLAHLQAFCESEPWILFPKWPPAFPMLSALDAR